MDFYPGSPETTDTSVKEFLSGAYSGIYQGLVSSLA